MKEKSSARKRVTSWIQRAIQFVRTDMYRVREDELTSSKRLLVRLLKKLILSIREFISDILPQKASSLTYYTVLCIIPIFALVLAIGRGFGFQDTIEEYIIKVLGPTSDMTPFLLEFVNNYLEQAKGGVFLGIGIALLLWSVMSMFRQIEATFNKIWNVKKSRSIIRQFTTYISLLLTVPILMILSSGLSVKVNAWVYLISESTIGAFFIPIYQFLVRLAPYAIYWLLFSLLFVVIPNTKVKWRDATLAGIVTGTLFLLMQSIYLSGIVSLNRYNVVYGSFAAIPLLLIMIQISWMIVLYGAELCFVSQNLYQYSYDSEIKNISRRYKDYLTVVVLKDIIEHFEKGERAPTVEEIAVKYNIPIRLVRDLIKLLQDCKLVSELYNEDLDTKTFQPALDINIITLKLVYDRIESFGAENFALGHNTELEEAWKALKEMREKVEKCTLSVLIKNL